MWTINKLNLVFIILLLFSCNLKNRIAIKPQLAKKDTIIEQVGFANINNKSYITIYTNMNIHEIVRYYTPMIHMSSSENDFTYLFYNKLEYTPESEEIVLNKNLINNHFIGGIECHGFYDLDLLLIKNNKLIKHSNILFYNNQVKYTDKPIIEQKITDSILIKYSLSK